MAPAFGPSLGGNSSLATLQRAYGEMQELEASATSTDDSLRSSYATSSNTSRQPSNSSTAFSADIHNPLLHHQQQQQQFRSSQQRRDAPPSPAFSIDAVSESDDDMISSLLRSNDSRALGQSPRIGDLTWSHEETGPFDVTTSSIDPNVPQGPSQLRASGKNLDLPMNGMTGQRGSAFDLNVAIADLLQEDEIRRRARREAGFDSATPETASRLSSPADPDPTLISRHMQNPAILPSIPPSTPSASGLRSKRNVSGQSTNDGSFEYKAPESTLTTPRRARNGSSSGIKVNASIATKLPSSTSAQNVRSTKRSSTASIGQSLLRGSLPLGAAEEFEGRLSGVDDAAEALRKLDGISTPRTSIASGGGNRSSARDPSRSPRSSKQLSRPGSAGHRSIGNASRGSSPSGRSIVSNAAPSATQYGTPRMQTEDIGSRSNASRRASRSITSPALHGVDSPRRTSLSSPRTRRSQLPPLPSTSIALPLGLSTPPTVAAPLPNQSNAQTNIQSTLSSNSRRTSAASVVSNGSIIAPRTSTSSKTKRGSDIPLPPDLQQQQHQLNAGLGLATTADDGAMNAISFGSLNVPPVPPLPKAWESSRSMNNILTDHVQMEQSPGLLSQSTTSQNSNDAGIISEASISPQIQQQRKQSTSQASKSPSLKWSLSQFGQSLSSKKSAEKLSSRKSLPATGEANVSRTSLGSGRSSLRPERIVTQSASDDKSIKIDQSSSFTANSSTSSLQISTPASVSGPRMSNEHSIRSPSITASPKSRRTPSFFRKRSSEAPSDEARKGKKSPSRDQEPISSPGTDLLNESVDNLHSNATQGRSEATTPSGRSSRKSILGLGSLLRSASRRNIDSMPTSAPAHLLPKSQSQQQTIAKLTNQNNAVLAGEESLSSTDSSFSKLSKTPSKTSGALETMRRASLIGRKRGKTLPSTNDPPKPVPSQQLPPMQMPPLTESQISPPRRRESQGINASASNDSGTGKRRLANSSSTGDLAGGRDKANAPTLPTITASPLTVTSTNGIANTVDDPTVTLTEKRVISSGAPTTTTVDSSLPVSRIPRASKRQSLAASQSSSFVRRLSGATGSNLPSSKTSASLASHLGISKNDASLNSVDSNPTSLLTADSILQNVSSPMSSSNPTGSSTTLTSILTAYTNAKTPAEVEVVLRRAKVATHSTAIAPREKEVLVSLIARQEEKKRQMQNGGGGGDAIVSNSNTLSTPQIQRTFKEPEKTPTNSTRISRDSLSASVGAPSNVVSFSTSASTNNLTSSVPARKARVSMTAISNSSRAAREATLLQQQQTMSRLSTPSSARGSPALTETVLGRSTNSTVSPSPTAMVNVDDEEREGDEEIESYIRRRHARKVAQGARLADLEKLLAFPEEEKASKAYSYRQAEALWGDKLTNQELEEIRSFKEIYFVGQNIDKNARVPTDGSTTQNNGYDDDRGDYLVINHDHLAFRYEVMSLLGRGSFGQVLQCKDHKTGKFVAIKLIRNKRRFHHQALVEVKILENLCKWDPNEEFNVIRIQDSFYFRNHLCISMELLSINLYELIKANSFAGFSTKLIRRITSQVLLSLSLLRRNRVVHCDLKPENILLMHPRRSAIKVIDFGSSCFEHEKVYTYIQSRFYRSPEVILGMNYHTAIDIWSLGCIIAELYSGYPLFPGENEQEQLACIMEILGVPDRYLVERSSRKKLFFDSTGAPRPVVNSKGKRRRPNTKTLSSALNCNDDLFLDFLAKCLHWDPERRIKPDAALRHPWIKRNVGRPEAVLGQGSTRRSSAYHSSAHGTVGVSGTPRRSLAASNTTSSLASGAIGAGGRQVSGSGMSISTSTPKLVNAHQASTQSHERRMSLRSAAQNGTNHSGGTNVSSSDPIKHTPLRSSQRNQQPVQ